MDADMDFGDDLDAADLADLDELEANYHATKAQHHLDGSQVAPNAAASSRYDSAASTNRNPLQELDDNSQRSEKPNSRAFWNCAQCTLQNTGDAQLTPPELDSCGLVRCSSTTPGICIDPNTATTYIYPDQVSRREYQFEIAHTALYSNTMVVLPTGLGKTLIAAVVMFNFYRWFPKGKVLFLAPTRPLVEQQAEACHEKMGLPYDETATIMGNTKKDVRATTRPLPWVAFRVAAVDVCRADDGKRSSLWSSKRVFYATPQTVMNDLRSGACPAESIVCLVVDEAHRATGVLKCVYPKYVQERFNYVTARNEFTSAPPPNLPQRRYPEVHRLLTHCQTLANGYSQMQAYSLKQALEYMDSMEGKNTWQAAQHPHPCSGLFQDFHVLELMKMMRHVCRRGINHAPKLDALNRIVQDYFQQNPEDSKIIIFTTYRESVKDIVEHPGGLVKAQCFVGQGLSKTAQDKGAEWGARAAAGLAARDIKFRILALSATPGSDGVKITERVPLLAHIGVLVAQVLKNLNIAKMEFRSEEDADVRKYIFGRTTEVVNVMPTEQLQEIQFMWLGSLEAKAEKLFRMGISPATCLPLK
eukprot:gene4933-6016_t